MTKNVDTISVGLSVILFLLAYVIQEPYIPILIYDYSDTEKTIQIWNTGLKPATNVLIEIMPKNELTITDVTHSSLNGELIIDQSKDGRIMYYLHHLYPKDRIFFTLNINGTITDNVDTIIRSNEGSGLLKAANFFGDLVQYLQIGLILECIALGAGLYFTMNRFLRKDKIKQDESRM